MSTESQQRSIPLSTVLGACGTVLMLFITLWISTTSSDVKAVELKTAQHDTVLATMAEKSASEAEDIKEIKDTLKAMAKVLIKLEKKTHRHDNEGKVVIPDD